MGSNTNLTPMSVIITFFARLLVKSYTGITRFSFTISFLVGFFVMSNTSTKPNYFIT